LDIKRTTKKSSAILKHSLILGEMTDVSPLNLPFNIDIRCKRFLLWKVKL